MKKRDEYTDEPNKKPSWREKLGKWEFFVWAVVIIAVCITLFLLLPNNQSALNDLSEWLKTAILWCRGAFVFFFVFGGPWILGVLMKAYGIQFLDGIISKEESMGKGKRFLLMMLVSLVIGLLWFFVLPASVTNPEFYSVLTGWRWATNWEIAPWSWGGYAFASSLLAYLLWWLGEAMFSV